MDEDSGGFFIIRAGQERLIASDPGEFLFLFEKDMTVEIQKLRHDLYFLHAAVLQFGNEAVMLVGESGSGKSTTAWGLLHHGFRYWSDELGPVDLQTLEVHPYPHALSLKHVPPEPYVPPKSTLYTSRSLYIPTVGLPSQVGRTPAPLLAVFFLRSRFGASAPRIQTMSKATAVAHLLANALNPLAHVGDGIDAAMKIAMNMASFDLTAADLRQTCILVKTTLHDLEKPAADGSVPGTL
jgi:ABC-type dipeptide/oligopeptide/nickel transport system ATPase component